ncbi:MAG: hypothetical protein KDA96_06755 [Planctomycetaceae bacterium]|nr:hypothetical protein [Planctomycetaceae bacterium]
MSKSRLSKRREIEAAEANAAGKKTSAKSSKDSGEKAAKKTTRKKAVRKTRRAREAAQRRRIVWVVYSSTMREEGRFLYHERDKAEERLEALLSKGKRRYFIQPIKEALNPDGTPVVQVGEQPPDDDADEMNEVPEGMEASEEASDELDLGAELDLDDDESEADAGEEEPAEAE